jgi:hypothetical protein
MKLRSAVTAVLAVLSLLLAIPLFMPDTTPSLHVQTVPRPAITIEKLPVPRAVRERVLLLNAFETDKDIHNWIARFWEPYGVVTKRIPAPDGIGSVMEISWRIRLWGELVTAHLPAAWEGYRFLALDIVNCGNKTVDAEVRVGDVFDPSRLDPRLSRFLERHSLLPGRQTWRIPLAAVQRQVRLGSPRKVVRLRFYTDQGLFTVDNLRLER